MPASHRSRVTTESSAQQNISVRPYALFSSLPRLITYDIFEEKSAQQLLCEAAQDRTNPERKWEAFTDKLEYYMGRKKLTKQLVKHLDDKKQCAPLHYAVFNQNTFVCDKLTAKAQGEKNFQCDINILTGNGENVLHIAARSNHIWQDPSLSNNNLQAIVLKSREQVKLPEIIITLIARGADVNHADDENRTPLHIAVMENRLSLVKYLLHKEANIYATTKLCANVLHLTFIPSRQSKPELAAMFNYLTQQLESARFTENFPWTQKPKNLAKACTLENRTPLVLAVCHPSITKEIVQELVNMMQIRPEDTTIRFDVNRSSPELNPLQTQMLMAIGQVARRQFKNYEHLSPIVTICHFKTRHQFFHFPCRYNNLALLKWLLEQCLPNNDPAMSKNTISILNDQDHAGYTPLLTATFYGSTKCVEYLLQDTRSSTKTNSMQRFIAAPIDATNAEGENILHICAKHPVSEDLLKLIWQRAIERGLLEKPDDDGNLPLHVAASSNQMDFCKAVLSDSKAQNDIRRIKNAHGQTAAHVATEAVPRHIGPERHYVEKHHSAGTKQPNPKAGAEDDDHDFGLPTLRVIWNNAAKGDRSNVLFEQDNDRQTCLHLAAAKGQNEIVKFLVEDVGLEIDCIADRRLTPLHLACQYGHGEVVAYLIENGASPTLRNAELYNCLEIAIMNQHEEVVKGLLTLPNWRELMRNAQPIPHTEAYDTPMRKLIRYMPEVTIWMIDQNLTRRLGGQGKHVFKTVYDYEFYVDIYLVKKWYTQGGDIFEERETFRERCDRRGCSAVLFCGCCCQEKRSKPANDMLAYTDDAYTLVRNHPLFIVGQQSQCPDLIEHPYNTRLRDRFYIQYGFYAIRVITFILYAFFLAVLTAIILSGKHPQYFYAKTNRNMTLDLSSCQIVSNNLTAANDIEALKTNIYKNMKWGLNTFFILYIIKNSVLIIALFPKVFRTVEYYLEISALVLCYVYVFDWYDWQSSLIFRCPIQYQLGAMGLLLGYINMLTYVRRIPWFDIGIFVTMLQLIFLKFIRFIPVLLIFILGVGFTHWMLLQNQAPFQSPVEALMRTGILTFELGYEDHLYNDQYYYQIIFVVTILSAIVFCIFILNLLISLAVGEIPSLTEQGRIWRSQMLYNLLSDYSILSLQFIRLINCLTCGKFHQWIVNKLIRDGKRLRPIVVIERDETGGCCGKAWKYVHKNFFDEKIQDDIILNKSSIDKKDEK